MALTVYHTFDVFVVTDARGTAVDDRRADGDVDSQEGQQYLAITAFINYK